MIAAVLVVLSFLLLGVAILAAEIVIARRRLREVRIVRCPAVSRAAALQLAAGRAAVDAALGATPRLEVGDCTRWPRAMGCDQKCLDQLAGDPEEARLAHKIRRWAEENSCSGCDGSLGKDDAPIFFVSPLGTKFDWEELPPDWLAEALEEWDALCERCGRGEAPQARSMKQ
ncbi:MAG TPA: hypothetical protein VFV54_11365 [Thermoanaerobaculia bacterium]|nr:hypothetical protein [Thermoanaerobaculia bacterium]